LSVAVAVVTPSLPVTVWLPATVEVQEEPAQEPPPLIVNVVSEVTSPRLASAPSKPSTVYAWLPAATMLAVAGVNSMLLGTHATVTAFDVATTDVVPSQ
jgi:hypothetical protein